MDPIESAANTAGVAEPLVNETDPNQNSSPTANNEPAAPVTQPGAADPGSQPDVTQTQAFASRLKDATTKAEQKARDTVIAEMKLADHAGNPITTYEHYKQAIERQRMIDQGVDPDVVNSLIANHPQVKAASMVIKNSEKTNFRDKPLFTELEPELDDIIRNNENVDVGTAYAFLLGKKLMDGGLDKLQTQAATNAQNETIKKLTQNAQTTPGALGGGQDPAKTSVKDMPQKDFDDMINRVKRGEKITL